MRWHSLCSSRQASINAPLPRALGTGKAAAARLAGSFTRAANRPAAQWGVKITLTAARDALAAWPGLGVRHRSVDG